MKKELDSLVSAFLFHVVNLRDRIAFISESSTLTYGAAGIWMAALARGLSKCGIKHGDRVGLHVRNDTDLALCYFAVHSLGAVAVFIDIESPDAAVAKIVEDCEARLLVSNKQAFNGSLPVVSFSELASEAADDLPEPSCRPNDLADLIYTTGTTNRPKGVQLTHANILSAARHINAVVQHGPRDVELVPIPLTHSFGLGRLRCMALAGNALILEPGMQNAAKVLTRLLESKATGLALVPAGFEILRIVGGERLGDARSHLRYIEIGSAPMRQETKEWLMRLLPSTRIFHHYGLTEATRAAFTEYHRDKEKVGTAGRASPGVTIKILDDDGLTVPVGKTGEIIISGGMVMQGYWRQKKLTEKTLGPEGLRSGDMGYLDPDGYLYLVGRKREMINVGGLNVIPQKVEAYLNQFPGVKESMCVGIPDPEGITGEAVKAYLVSDNDISERNLVNWLRENLVESEIPRFFERVEMLPKTSSGKLIRKELST